MTITKCSECGCPQTDRRLHYKTCSIGAEYNRKYEADLKILIEDQIRSLENSAQYWKKQAIEDSQLAGEWRDALKLTCLDEVYECRLDCRNGPEGVWLLNLHIALL